MLYHLASVLTAHFGPARLLQSYSVLILFALYGGFIVTFRFLPRFYSWLPHDRGREFTLTAEAAKGKPTGAGSVFISFFVIATLFFIPLDAVQAGILALTWLTMLTGFLDDRSLTSWGEYRKALLDLALSVGAAVLLAYAGTNDSGNTSFLSGTVHFWVPFTAKGLNVPVCVFIAIAVVMIWASINTTNCTDGVDGLSGTLVLIALLTLGIVFYFILGHVDIATYLLVPPLAHGASWAGMAFCLAGVLMGYLWHNAFPSKVLMGDAGSRALGFFIGVCVMVSGNPFMIFATSTIIFINGGMGLLKVFLLRFFKIKIFQNIRFPLHDHVRKIHNWSPTQVLVKFMIMQILITVAMIGVFFKIR